MDLFDDRSIDKFEDDWWNKNPKKIVSFLWSLVYSVQYALLDLGAFGTWGGGYNLDLHFGLDTYVDAGA